jgi:hypothetical protein
MKNTLIAIVIGFALNGPEAPAETPAQRGQLRQALAAIDADIAATHADSDELAGGLTKALIRSRLAVLEQTKAMLNQRMKASDFSITLHFYVDGKPFSGPPDAAVQLVAIETELTGLKVMIGEQEAQTARYADPLAQAISLRTLATSRQSLAMLEQKRLALKYGLPQYIGFADGAPQAPKASAEPPAPATNVTRITRR